MKKSTLCVIPARKGSKRIPHKNLRDFLGKPIIAYSIEAVRESGIADIIMVSTDSVEIAEVARYYGADIPFLRSKETADDQSGIADVLLEVVGKYRELGDQFDYIICVLPTAPLIQPSNLRKAFGRLKDNKEADSICSVESFSYPPQRGLVIRNGKLEMPYPEYYSARSQDLEKIYHDCGQFFIFKTQALLRDRKLYTKNAIPFMIDEMESQDIDSLADWKIAELKYELIHREDHK